ncbi:PP2C family serine/threonine-protein phosphatase [Nocardioides sp. CFH 31398]|uniref:PP2C family protein-serine/threonine phosphatase n=1 Tax=Nocardioides sp. CFH 31398 TaxID=2919579 RepID=UPI001F0682D8|nr:protein phosphatase 2C domain-containing protein [Nocardioides sp. CFH 31398]MCH1865668.1 protein phosphatase 2C domain-containing protein [Nocardioides sp. CFH 31398]
MTSVPPGAPDPTPGGPGEQLSPEQAAIQPRTEPLEVPPSPDDDTMQSGDGMITPGTLRLSFSAVSDVGRVRKDNQDSGYAGAWLLAVCDGVGGGARGDIASSTAISQLRRLDEAPGEDLLGLVAGGLHRAHDRIAELVDEDPALNGTSTTATVALFDGTRVGVAHVGDSRAYLMRSRTLTQLTRDHTFVQSLIDEGRITEEEARTHPHRNLILKALDGMRDPEPDLFVVDLAVGDRLFLCSDGACGVLDDATMLGILADGTPDSAALEMVQAALAAGSTDNVTCVVADVVPVDLPPEPGSAAVDESGALAPLLVGAASELPRRGGGSGTRSIALFRGHRGSGEATSEERELPAEAPHAISSDPIDPERARYAPRPPRRFLWLRRLLVAAVVVGVLWAAGAALWSWTQSQYYVGEAGGVVTIYRGLNAEVPGIDLSSPLEESDIPLEELPSTDAQAVRNGIEADDLEDARATVDDLAGLRSEGSGGLKPENDPSEQPSQDPSQDPSQQPSQQPSQGSTGQPDQQGSTR